MARTIDYFGNVIFVTAAGTCTYENLDIECIYVWATDSNSSLIVTDVTSGSAMQILRYSNDSSLNAFDNLGITGKFGKISFDTVTTCSAWIIKR